MDIKLTLLSEISRSWDPDVDYLGFMYYWVFGMFRYKMVKIFAVYSCMVQVFSLLVQTYYMLATFDSVYLIQHGPVYFGVLYAINTVGSFIALRKGASEMHAELWRHLRCIEHAPQEIKDMVSTYTWFMKLFVKINTCMMLVAVSAMVSDIENEAKLFFFVEWLRTFFPDTIGVFTFLYYITFIFVGYVMTVPLYVFIYFVAHVDITQKIVIYYGRKKMFDIPVTEEDCHLVHDDEYQENVHKTIKFWAVGHRLAVSGTDVPNEKIGICIVGYTIFGTLLGLCIIYYSQVLVYLPLRGMVRFASVGIIAASNIIIFCSLGQKLTDVTDEVQSIILEAPWYRWNTKNRKKYLVILTNFRENNGFRFHSLISVDRVLIMRMYKAIYSVGSVITAQSLNQVNLPAYNVADAKVSNILKNNTNYL